MKKEASVSFLTGDHRRRIDHIRDKRSVFSTAEGSVFHLVFSWDTPKTIFDAGCPITQLVSDACNEGNFYAGRQKDSVCVACTRCQARFNIKEGAYHEHYFSSPTNPTVVCKKNSDVEVQDSSNM